MIKNRLRWLFVLLMAMGVATSVDAQYCTTGVGPSSTADSNLDSLDLAGESGTALDFDNACSGTAGVTGVQDQTAQNVELAASSTYTFNITPGTCGGTFGNVVAAWIDYNQDGDWEDAGEEIFNGGATVGTLQVFSFTVPATAYDGATRMRVRQHEATATTPCAAFSWGTTVDFSVTITGGFVPTCPAPSALAAANITGNGADISWTAGGAETTWDLHIVTAGTGGPAAADPGNTPDVTTNPYAFAAPTDDTTYDVYLRADCGAADTSDWIGPLSVAIPCAVQSTPATEAFDTFTPACWEEGDQGDIASGPTTLGAGAWGASSALGDAGARINLWNLGDSDWILSPAYDLSAGGFGVVLDVAVAAFSGGGVNPSNMGGDDTVDLLYSEDGGATWTSIKQFTQSDAIPNAPTSFAVAVPSMGSAVSFAVLASEGSVDDPEDYYFYVTNFELTNCLSVSGTVVDNVLDTSVDVSWDANTLDPSATYSVDVQENGVSIAGYPVTGVTGNSYAVTGLTLATEYSVVVSPDCDPAGSEEVLFATLNCLPGDRCSYTLTVSDFGDGGGVNYNGWVTGAVVQVTTGNQITNYSIPAGTYGGPQSDNYTILACPGDSLEVEYIGTPENAGETWTISGPGGLNYQPATPDQGITVIACPNVSPAFDLSTSNVCEDSFDASWTNGAVYDSVEVTWNYFVPPFFFFSGTSGYINGSPTTATVNATGAGTPWAVSSSINYSVIGYLNGEAAQTDGTFDTPACVCADQCTYEVVLFDQFDDGFEADVEVVVDGAVVATLTAASGETPDTTAIGVCPGSTIDFNYLAGSFRSEHTVEIIGSIEGTLFSENANVWATDAPFYSVGNTCPDCIAPADLAAINVAADSARLVWNDPAMAADFDIAIELAGGTAGAGTYTNVLDTTYLATGLTEQTDYVAYLAANCVLGPSDTIEVAFTTGCAVKVAPYVEDFENGGAIPSCWEQGAANVEDWQFTTDFVGFSPGHIGNAGSFGSSGSGGYLAVVDDSSPHNFATTLLSPMIDVSGLTIPELAFFLISNREDATNVELLVDVWDGAAWNNVLTNNDNTAGGDWEFIALDLSGLTITGDIQVRFVVNENNGSDFDDDVAIDDFEIREKPACPAPTSMAAANITETSADLSWSAGATETVWDLHIDVAGSAAPAEADPGNTPNLTATTYAFAGGTAATSYDVYYRAECGAADSSAWVGPYTFTTSTLSDNYCAAGPSSGADSNLDQVNITGDNGTSLSYTADCASPVTGVNDQTTVDTLELEAGLMYDLQIVWGTCGGNFGNAGEAWIDFDGSGTFEAAESIVAHDFGNPTVDSTYQFQVPFSAADGAVVAMRVMQREGGATPMDPCGTYSWGGVADFAVALTNTNPCPGVSGLAIDVTGETTATLTWNEVGGATDWFVESVNGPAQGTAGNDTTATTMTSTSFTGLVGGTTYYAWVASDCQASGDTSAWSTISWVQPVPGATCDLPIEITSTPYMSGTINSAGYGDDYSASPCNGSYMGGDDVVFRYSPAADICHSIEFNAITSWQGFHILDGCPDDPATTCLYADGGTPDMFASGTGVRLIESFFFTGGQDYYFVASTFPAPQSGTFEFNLGDCPSCAAPANLSPHNITESSADVGFESIAAAINGSKTTNYAYGLNGFTIGGADQVGGGTLSDPLGMVADTINLTGLSGSSTYQVCLWEDCEALTPGAGGSDTVCVTFQTLIGNDDCTTAAPIACGDIISGFTTGATVSTPLGFFTGINESAPDVWFTFTGANSDDPAALAGTPGDQVTLSTCNDGGATAGSAAYDTKIDVYTSCTPASAADFVGGNDDGLGCTGFSSLFSFPTVVGDTYYVRIYGYTGGSQGSFDLSMTCEPPCLPVPANDECANAEALALQVYGTAPATAGYNSCATAETFNPTCDPFGTISGVWYTFTTDPSGDTYFSLEATTATEIHYALFSGDQCAGTGVQEDCEDINGNTYSNVFYSLEPDSTYQVLVWSDPSESGDFNIGVSGPPPPPANDDIEGAQHLSVASGNACDSGTPGTLISATQSPAPALSGECGLQTNGHNDVWYSAIVPASGRVLIDFPVAPDANTFVELHTGTSAAPVYVPLSCSAINPKVHPTPGADISDALTPGDSLFIRIWDAGNNVFGDFEICITDPVPANDDCASAVALPVTDFGTPSWTEGRSDYAFGEGSTCGADEEVVWYSFEATDANNMIVAGPIAGSGGNYDAVIEVFDACGGTSLGCFDNYGGGTLERVIAGGLVAGNTYYYTVSHSGGAESASSDEFRTGVRGFNDGSLDPAYCDEYGYTLDNSVYAVRDDLGDLYSNPNVPVRAYSFRFQEVGGGLDASVDQPDLVPYVNLENVPGLEYGKTYDASVRHRVRIDANGTIDEYYSDYQATCEIGLGSDPTTQLADGYCNTVDHQLADQIFADPVTNATLYKWTFVGGGQTLIEYSNNYTLFLYTVEYQGESLLYQTAYDVTVQALVNGEFTPTGSVCSLGMGSPEDAEVQSAYCGGTYDFPAPNFILATQVYGADSYTWRFTPVGGGAVQETTTPGLSLAFHITDLNLDPGQYHVEVKVTAGGVTGDYVNPGTCTVTINAAPEMDLDGEGDLAAANKLGTVSNIDASVYPNPSTGENIYISLNDMTDENQTILIEVVDVTGKTVHAEQVVNKGSDANLVIDFDSPLSAGMYFVNMTVNEEKVVQMLSVE